MPCSPNLKDWRVLIVVALLHSSPSSRLSASSRHYPILHNSSLPLYHSSHAGAVALAAALPLPIVTGLARHPVAVLVEADEVDELVAHAGYQVATHLDGDFRRTSDLTRRVCGTDRCGPRLTAHDHRHRRARITHRLHLPPTHQYPTHIQMIE